MWPNNVSITFQIHPFPHLHHFLAFFYRYPQKLLCLVQSVHCSTISLYHTSISYSVSFKPVLQSVRPLNPKFLSCKQKHFRSCSLGLDEECFRCGDTEQQRTEPREVHADKSGFFNEDLYAHYYYYYYYYYNRYECLLSQVFSSWHFSWTSGIPNAQASSFTLQDFPYYVWCSKYSCFL